MTAKRLVSGIVLVLGVCAQHAALAADPGTVVALGRGGYATQPHAGGLFSSADASPPAAPFRTAAMLKQAAPTNTWYASLMFERWSHPLFAQPLSYRAGPDGFEIGAPQPVLTQRPSGAAQVEWPHRTQLTVSPTDFKPDDARLAGHGDWNVDIRMAHGSQAMQISILHGSPFSYYRLSQGDALVQTAAAAQIEPGAPAGVACFTVGKQVYAVFAPQGGSLQWATSRSLRVHLPPGHGYFSVAALPSAQAEVVRTFQAHAFAFVTDTELDWQYQPQTSQVLSRFSVRSQTMQGAPTAPIIGLYPHQWRRLPGLALPFSYASVRGEIKAAPLNGFETALTYHGIVPLWPALSAADGGARVDTLLGGDVGKTDASFDANGHGTYWFGKQLGRAAQLMNIAEAQGRSDDAATLQSMLEARLQTSFSGHDDSRYFMVDHTIGTTVGYPEEFWSVSHMNDHHFHYGYWINAAAQLALRDPQWAQPQQWGGMVGLLVNDIANDHRHGSDTPYLRNFDPYAGHSWASGDALMDQGNNQESSSEAINAWAGLIFWGAATGNTQLRDLGIALYTTEADAIATYWFDTRHQVFSADYPRPLAAQVFSDKYAYNTWWTENPREIQGINLLPITPASTYLGADPAVVSRFFDGLHTAQKQYTASGSSDGTPDDIWQDILVEYQALADPAEALQTWNDQGSVEAGDSRTHTYYWIKSLQAMGRPDPSVHADTPMFAVFKRADGSMTYLACNASAATQTVAFSDGTRITVPAHSLQTLRRARDGTASQSTLDLRPHS